MKKMILIPGNSVCVLIAAVLAFAVFLFPSRAEARSTTTVTIGVGGALVLAGGYVGWNVIFSKRTSASSDGHHALGDKKNEEHASTPMDAGEETDSSDGPGDAPKPVIYLPLLSLKF